jgi:hypothetical protein
MLIRNATAAAINLVGWKLDAGDRSQRVPWSASSDRIGTPARARPSVLALLPG